MLKYMVLWIMFQGEPRAVAAAAVDTDTGVPYLNSQKAIDVCEKNAHYFRTLGITAWCVPHIDL